jgi:hypothetical protein
MNQVQGYPPGELREYIPECDGNRERETPIKVWIRTPTEGQKRRLAVRGEVVRFDSSGEVNDPGMLDLERIIERQERFCSAFVDKVENYQDAGGKPIATAADFIENAVPDVIAEVALEIERSLSLEAEQTKKSAASPDS